MAEKRVGGGQSVSSRTTSKASIYIDVNGCRRESGGIRASSPERWEADMARLTRLTQLIVISAVDRLPPADRVRWSEEWAADLLCCGGRIAQFFRALGIWLGAARISFSNSEGRSLLRLRAAFGASGVVVNLSPPRNLLESMGRKFADECTPGERRAFKRAWYNPNDAGARREADIAFNKVAARLNGKTVRSHK